MMEKDVLVLTSMKMISSAGDGRAKVQDAIDLVKENKLEEAEAILAEAHQSIIEAHKGQTSVLQQAMGNDDDYAASLLFSHAQDTLMTINSEYYLAKDLIECYKSLNERISKLEKTVYEKD